MMHFPGLEGGFALAGTSGAPCRTEHKGCRELEARERPFVPTKEPCAGCWHRSQEHPAGARGWQWQETRGRGWTEWGPPVAAPAPPLPFPAGGAFLPPAAPAHDVIRAPAPSLAGCGRRLPPAPPRGSPGGHKSREPEAGQAPRARRLRRARRDGARASPGTAAAEGASAPWTAPAALDSARGCGGEGAARSPPSPRSHSRVGDGPGRRRAGAAELPAPPR